MCLNGFSGAHETSHELQQKTKATLNLSYTHELANCDSVGTLEPCPFIIQSLGKVNYLSKLDLLV